METEGARSLLNGLAPTLVGIVPYAGLSFATFETLKAKYIQNQNIEHDLDIPTIYRLAFGGVAGLFAQSMTYPLDLVRRRMQVAAPGEPVHYRGIVPALATIAKEEGPIGLYVESNLRVPFLFLFLLCFVGFFYFVRPLSTHHDSMLEYAVQEISSSLIYLFFGFITISIVLHCAFVLR